VPLAGWDVERWLRQMPTVEEARPATCPLCGVPSRPVGAGLGLHGHGVRSRQAWGPLSTEAEPEIHDVPVRRYQCQSCGQTITVAPESMARRYLYMVTTMAAALWEWGRRREPARRVRQRLSPLRIQGASRPGRWDSLSRWTAQCERLWPEAAPSLLRAIDAAAPVREQAAQVSMVLAAFGDGPFCVDGATEAAACRGAIRGLAM
jgi:hypothetical protein